MNGDGERAVDHMTKSSEKTASLLRGLAVTEQAPLAHHRDSRAGS